MMLVICDELSEMILFMYDSNMRHGKKRKIMPLYELDVPVMMDERS
jgi:hypothetical protein